MLLHLPPGLVELLNAVYWRQDEFEPEYELFCETWQDVKGWHDFHGSFAVSEKEQRDLDNFTLLWNQVSGLLEEPLEFETLATPVYETVSIMNQVNEDRRFPHYSPIPAVNEILLAGAAFCMEQGSARAVRDRLPLLAECVTNLRGLYYEQQDGLPEEVRATLSEGFDLMESGVETVHTALPDREAVQEGLALIKDGASLAEFLLEWDQKEKQRLRELYSRFNIPLIGSDLEIGLESVKSVDRRKWRRGAKSTEAELFPKLEEFWKTVRPHLFLPPEEREALLQDVEEALVELKGAVADLKGKEFEDAELIEALSEALEWTSEAFTAIEQAALKPDAFGRGVEREIFEAVKGVCSGTVPDAALVELVQGSEIAPHDMEPFQAYLAEGDRTLLHDAVWALLDSVLARAEAEDGELGSWTCTLCGYVNERGALSCGECRVIRKGS